MSHTLTARAESGHEDVVQPMMSTAPVFCNPGVLIRVEYHPGHEQEALDALDSAYLVVRAQIRPKEPK